ncbi:zinc ribbon domain-containing protein [Rouxiella chamberiensis]|nr:zinc ribbon domain-containing protein [Rouxiella chamberiensis]
MLGFIILVVGIICAISAFTMDVSVLAGNGYRVNNIGLMSTRQNGIILGGFISLCGLLLAIFSDKITGSTSKQVKCPLCAELISPEAIKCKHCGSTIENNMTSNASVPDEEIKPESGYPVYLLIAVLCIFAVIGVSLIISRIY